MSITINGKNLYGWFVISVIPVTNGAVNRVPAKRIKMLFAYLLFFDTMNNPTVSGIKNTTNTLSSLIEKTNAVNPNQNSFGFQSNPTSVWNDKRAIPIRIIIKNINAIIIFLCFGISELRIKKIDIGANNAIKVFEKIEST